MTGPSTNYYVGPQNKHYTIPKRLIYYFSDHARMCLEGSFAEARANAVRLSDVDPEIFQWLWQWLYTGKLRVFDHYCGVYGSNEQRTKACLMLCRVHHLAERLLFNYWFLKDVQVNLEKIIAEGETEGQPMLLSPDIVGEVLSDSRPVRYEANHVYPVRYGTTSFSPPRLFISYDSLRPYILGFLCTFEFCTTVDFMEYADSFLEDGAFAAEIMAYMANETRWAIHRWGWQVDWAYDVAELKQKFANWQPFDVPTKIPPEKPQAIDATQLKGHLEQIRNAHAWMETPPKIPEEVWSALKATCTSVQCTTDDLRDFSPYFGLDAAFTAELLAYMAAELSWVVDSWGYDRHEVVDWAAEKAEEEREEEQKELMEGSVWNAIRQGWASPGDNGGLGL